MKGKSNKIENLAGQISERRRRKEEKRRKKAFPTEFCSCPGFELLFLLQILPRNQICCRDQFCTNPSLGDVLFFQTKLNQVSQ